MATFSYLVFNMKEYKFEKKNYTSLRADAFMLLSAKSGL